MNISVFLHTADLQPTAPQRTYSLSSLDRTHSGPAAYSPLGPQPGTPRGPQTEGRCPSVGWAADHPNTAEPIPNDVWGIDEMMDDGKARPGMDATPN